jgi:hypothetical protein
MRTLASLSLLALLAGATPALADGFITATPAVHVSLPATASQAQLAAQLATQGYSNVQLTAAEPNLAVPHPELTAPTANLAATPVRDGWNGTAAKDGETVNVYAGE